MSISSGDEHFEDRALCNRAPRHWRQTRVIWGHFSPSAYKRRESAERARYFISHSHGRCIAKKQSLSYIFARDFSLGKRVQQMTDSAAKDHLYLPGAAFTSAERESKRSFSRGAGRKSDLNGGNLAKFKFIVARGRSHLARSIALH